MKEETILIVTSEDESSSIDGQRSWGQVQQRLNKAAEIPVSVLEQNMNNFLRVVARIFNQVDQQVGEHSKFRLDEVALQIEVGGKGEVKLVAGGEASGKGAITLKFKIPN